MLGFIGCSLSPWTNLAENGTVFGASGWPLLINELMYIFAASVGASFSILFQLNKMLAEGPAAADSDDFSAVGGLRFVVGVTAGFILAMFFDFGESMPDNADVAVETMSAAAIALLGGFAAHQVQLILLRFTEILQTSLAGTGACQDLVNFIRRAVTPFQTKEIGVRTWERPLSDVQCLGFNMTTHGVRSCYLRGCEWIKKWRQIV